MSFFGILNRQLALTERISDSTGDILKPHVIFEL